MSQARGGREGACARRRRAGDREQGRTLGCEAVRGVRGGAVRRLNPFPDRREQLRRVERTAGDNGLRERKRARRSQAQTHVGGTARLGGVQPSERCVVAPPLCSGSVLVTSAVHRGVREKSHLQVLRDSLVI